MQLPPSIGFPDRLTLSYQEIAQRLACTRQHIINLVQAGSIVRGKAKIEASIKARRCQANSYRRFLADRCTVKTPDFSPRTIPWPSLDFAGPIALTPAVIGQRLRLSPTHIIMLIEEGSLVAFDLKGAPSERNYYRVPVEAYRCFIDARIIRPKQADS